MATTDDLILRMKAQGARQAARDVDKTSKSVRGLDKRSNLAFRSVTKLGGGMRAIGTGAIAAGVGVTALGAAFATKAIGEFRESQKVGNQTAAAIQSMGASSWTSSKQIGDLANAISVKAGVDDEAIQSAANLLLTFGQVRNEVGKGNDIFDRATQAAVDLSAAGFGSMSSTSKQLGKALNDPVKGITALNKSGVTFTKKQKDTIKSLVAHNKTLEAQKIIMREVERQVKGSAEAQADPIDKLKVAWGNLLETAGKPIWGVVSKAIERITPALQHVSSTAGRVFDDKNMKWSEKFRTIGRSFKHWFGPMVEDAVNFAKPKLNAALEAAGPAAARAFVKGFKAAPTWVKLVTAGFLIAKMRPVFQAFGSLAAASTCFGMKGKLATCLAGRGMQAAVGGTTAAPLATAFAASWVAALGPALIAAGIGGAIYAATLPTTGRKAATSGNPEGVRAHHKIAPGDGPTGAQIYHRRTGDYSDVTDANTKAYRGYQGIPTVHTHVHIDGKQVAHAVTKAGKKAKATR